MELLYNNLFGYSRGMKKKAEGGEWLTTGQAAARIGISRQAVTKAILEGRLAYQKAGEFYLIRREAVESYVKGKPGRKKSTQD